MCLCGTDVQYSYFVSPDRYHYRLQLSTDSKFCMQLGTPISMPTARTPFIGRLYFIYQSIGQIITFQMMPPLRSFDDLDGKERGLKKTDDLRAMTTLGPRTLPQCSIQNFSLIRLAVWENKSKIYFQDGHCGGHIGYCDIITYSNLSPPHYLIKFSLI